MSKILAIFIVLTLLGCSPHKPKIVEWAMDTAFVPGAGFDRSLVGRTALVQTNNGIFIVKSPCNFAPGDDVEPKLGEDGHELLCAKNRKSCSNLAR